METGAVDSATTNQTALAAMAEAMRTQNAAIAVIMQTLEEVQSMQAQMMQSMGVGANIDMVA